ncbi:hypothetical protein [Nocardiopsis oceani]
MPRLSHTLDLDPVDRGDVTRTVSAVQEVLRSARFDDSGELLLPEERDRERLERRAEGLGLVPSAAERAERDRERERDERLADLSSPEDRADEAAVREASLSLRLLSGEHLAPGSRYLLTEVDAEGAPVFGEGSEGWVGTDLTVTAWDESGVCSVDFAMRDGAEDGQAPVTTGSVSHDRAEQTVTAYADLGFPVESALVKRGSSLLRAQVTARVDLRAWFAAAAGGSPEPPATLEVEHRLARAEGRVAPAPGQDGLWSVVGDLELRGRGAARPLVAVAAWALLRSVRRADEKSVEQRATEIAQEWNDHVRVLPELPGFLEELAEALAKAEPRSRR